MSSDYVTDADLEWRCTRCDCALTVGPVKVVYMDNQFSTELAGCPQCGLVLVSEPVALGKMAEVEQILEDK